MSRFLTALPVYNEVRSVQPVLDQVVRYSRNVLVVDDGSTDGNREHFGRPRRRADSHAHRQPRIRRGFDVRFPIRS